MKKLSVALAVYNEERYLRRCLDSIRSIADEIIIVDGGSTDSTVSIAKSFATRIIETDNPKIFHINKQKALEACIGEWILQLDADEVVSDLLRDEIKREISNKTQSFSGFYIPRRNIFWGHWMRKTGVYPDYVIRLVKNGKATFPCKSVHEQIRVDGPIGYLEVPLEHYSYETMNDYWRKADAYTSLTAQEMKTKKVSKAAFIEYGFVKPIQTFFTLFIRNQGFIDGIYGLLFSLFSALHFPIAFWKYISRSDFEKEQ